MDRVKIQEIADEAGASNAVLIEKAKELGYDVKAANSTVTIEQAGILIDYTINGVKPKASKPKTVKEVDKKRTVRKGKITVTPKNKEKSLNFVENNIKYWLIPSNPKEYNAVEELGKGSVWWSNKLNNMKIDDIVYIYISQPIQQISIKTRIIDTDEEKKVFCLELIRFLDSDKLHFNYLLKNGLTNVQGKREIKNLSLLKYIQDNENIINDNDKEMAINKEKKKIFSEEEIVYDFKYKNILLKGVPGTGKSRMIDKIINHHLKLEKHQENNVLRINIHSASSNADLMQGIGISSNEKGEIEYKERQGLIFDLIEKATFNPNQPFALVLEEIQENSLNELIGDLIYLIEDSKRAKNLKPDNKEYTYKELLEKVLKDSPSLDKVKMPNLISQDSESKVMIMPNNLFVFCTSNYRDDRKVIEDNLLRRFEVIEIYPKYKEDIGDDFKSEDVSTFLKALNESIISVCKGNGEIHPDRFMIGHSTWLDVEGKERFSRAFLKVITEFKDVKDTHFDDFQKIVKDLEFPFEVEKAYTSYEEWIKVLQNECYDFLNLK